MKFSKSKLFSFLFLLLCGIIAFSVNIRANAYEISSEDSDIKVDKFKPSTGVKVKSSPIAQAMENATYNKTHKGEPQKDTSISTMKRDESSSESNFFKNQDATKFRWF